MLALVKQATEHWDYLAPLLSPPQDEAEYDARVQALDEILDMMDGDDDHPFASLASHLGDVIEAYDEAHRPMPNVSGVEVLRYLMQEHNISQGELPEVGAQPIVSAILNGKRKLNWRQICGLSERFNTSADVFKDPRPTFRVLE